MASLQQIISWFKEGLFPNEDQFRQTWLSYWHKSEKIPQTQVFGLQDSLDTLSTGMIYKEPVQNLSDLATTYPNPQKGWSVQVINEKNADGNSLIYQWDGAQWNNTGMVGFPADTVKKAELDEVKDEIAQISRELPSFGKNFVSQYKGGYVSSTGNIQSSSNPNLHKYIIFPAQEGEKFIFFSDRLVQGGASQYIAYLGTENTPIEAAFNPVFGANILTAPAGCENIAITLEFSPANVEENKVGNWQNQAVFRWNSFLQNLVDEIQRVEELQRAKLITDLMILSPVNLINPNTITDGCYINANGSLTLFAAYGTTDFIPIEPDMLYTGINTESETNFSRKTAFFSADKTPITSAFIDAMIQSFTTPSNAAYVRVSVWAGNYANRGLFIGENPVFEPFESSALLLNYLRDTASKSNQELASIGDIRNATEGIIAVTEGIKVHEIESNNLLNPATITKGYIVNQTNGTLNTGRANVNYDSSDYIPVTPGLTYKALDSASNPIDLRRSAFYNSAKTFISGNDTLQEVTAPANAAFIRFSISNSVVGYDPVKRGLFLSTILQFDEFANGIDYEINDVATEFKTENSLATIADIRNIAKPDPETQSDLKFTKSSSTIVFQNPKGTITLGLDTGNNGQLNFRNSTFKDININNSDDSAPIHAMNTTIGANHGQPYARATFGANHNLTPADIGTAWINSNGKTFYLIEITSETVAGFLSEAIGNREDFSFSNFSNGSTFTRGGTVLTVTATTGVQWYPGVLNQSVKIMKNGNEEITLSGNYTADFVDVIERYTLKNYYDILQNLKANAGSTNPQYVGGELITFENIYRFLPNGTCLVIANMRTNQNLKFQDYMFSQAGRVSAGDVYYYVPNSLPISGYDFRTPNNVAWATTVPSLYFRLENWADPNNPPNRVIAYYNNTGFMLGFIKDYGVGRNLPKYTSATFELRNNTGKIYPHGVDSVALGNMMPADSVHNAVMFRAFTDLEETRIGNRLSMFTFDYNGYKYFYLDYSGSMLDQIILDESFNGKHIDILEAVNTVIGSDVYNEGVYITANYIEEETCFAVLKIAL